MTDTIPETLDAVLDDCWQRWARAKADRRSPLHTPVICSLADGTPVPRVMVLRGVDRARGVFRFHTDARSPKAADIDGGAPVSVLGYDPGARIQLTFFGTGRIERAGAVVDNAWSESALSSRRCYLAAHPPGTALSSPGSGLPDALLTRAPTANESEAGRANFVVLLVEAVRLEWLKLTACGNRRARFHAVESGWQGTWLTP